MEDEKIVGVLQNFANQVMGEVNKLSIRLDEIDKRMGVIKENLPEEKEIQKTMVIEPIKESKPNHHRTGEYLPGCPEVAVENFFYCGQR